MTVAKKPKKAQSFLVCPPFGLLVINQDQAVFPNVYDQNFWHSIKKLEDSASFIPVLESYKAHSISKALRNPAAEKCV